MAAGRQCAVVPHEARVGSACGDSYSYLSYGKPADDACARVCLDAYTTKGCWYPADLAAGAAGAAAAISTPSSLTEDRQNELQADVVGRAVETRQRKLERHLKRLQSDLTSKKTEFAKKYNIYPILIS